MTAIASRTSFPCDRVDLLHELRKLLELLSVEVAHVQVVEIRRLCLFDDGQKEIHTTFARDALEFVDDMLICSERRNPRRIVSELKYA